jgi:hypothetical protein
VRNVYKIFIGNLPRKKELGTPTLRWKVNVKMNLAEIKCMGAKLGLHFEGGT